MMTTTFNTKRIITSVIVLCIVWGSIYLLSGRKQGGKNVAVNTKQTESRLPPIQQNFKPIEFHMAKAVPAPAAPPAPKIPEKRERIYKYVGLDWDKYEEESALIVRAAMPDFNVEQIRQKYGKLNLGGDFKHDKWIVLTTIQGPTEDVKYLSKMEGWRVVVVGDMKTPSDWKFPNCDFISVDFAENMGLQMSKYLPHNAYSRKNIGYLYAIAHGAKTIYETDDDNRPMDDLKSFNSGDKFSGLMFAGSKLFNVYQCFGHSTLWQRGFPLNKIGSKIENVFSLAKDWPVPMAQQGVVNGDPDMDGIFRLTRKFVYSNLEVRFDRAAPPILVPPGVFSPTNTQNTFFHRSGMWSLFVSSSMNWRICDIWRAYITQRLMWEIGGFTAFYPPNAYQQRNNHDMLYDAADESELYFTTPELIDFLYKWTCPADLSFYQCYYKLICDLVDTRRVILVEKDVTRAKAWLEDLVVLGLTEPKRVDFKQMLATGKNGESLEKFKANVLKKGSRVRFAPNEQEPPTLSWQPENFVSKAWKGAFEIKSKCTGIKSISNEFIDVRERVNNNFLDVLVVFYYNSENYEEVKNMELYYRSIFPNIAYCGPNMDAFDKVTVRKDKLPNGNMYTFIEISEPTVSGYACMAKALQIKYSVNGVLALRGDAGIEKSMLDLSTILTLDKNKILYTPGRVDSQSSAIINGAHGTHAYRKAIDELGAQTVPSDVEVQVGTFREQLDKDKNNTPFVSNPVYYIPKKYFNSAEFYLSYFATKGVASEIAVPAVMKGFTKDFGSFGSKNLFITPKEKSSSIDDISAILCGMLVEANKPAPLALPQANAQPVVTQPRAQAVQPQTQASQPQQQAAQSQTQAAKPQPQATQPQTQAAKPQAPAPK